MMRPEDTILGPARGTLTQAKAYAAQFRFPDADRDVSDYLTEVFRLAPLVGIDPSIVVAQSALETSAWSSTWWVTRRNPAGIGITGDPAQNAASKTWANGTDAARAQIVHLCAYVQSDLVIGPTLGDFVPLDPRWRAVFDAGWNDSVRTIADLAGKWAVDPGYAEGICARGNAIFPDLPDQGGTVSDLTQPPYVLVDAGHREAGTGGSDANPVERDLTDDMAESYVSALRQAGYRADWFQRDVDRDSLPRDTQGSLDTVALGANAWLGQQPNTNLVFVSCHYNGAHSPFHVIYPDETGLTTAYPGGAPGYDTAANNPLDVRVTKTIADELAKVPGMNPLFNAGLFSGTMSERNTGVGLQGFRLALFAATVPVRDRCVRLVVEHGGTDDLPAQRATFTQECAAAFVRALGAVYGKPPTKPPKYAKRTPIPGPIEDKVVGGREFVVARKQRVTLQHDRRPRAEPKEGSVFFSGSIVKAGKVLTLQYVTAGEDGRLWRVSANGSYYPASAFVP
jgi:hypothetical protein